MKTAGGVHQGLYQDTPLPRLSCRLAAALDMRRNLFFDLARVCRLQLILFARGIGSTDELCGIPRGRKKSIRIRL